MQASRHGLGVTLLVLLLVAAAGAVVLVRPVSADDARRAGAVAVARAVITGRDIRFVPTSLRLRVGERARVELAPKAGAFDVVCTVAGHREAGMVGQVVVS